MDKYEYNLKLDQMKSHYAEEKYDEAADIADTINWNKVKNVNGLVKAGEVYEKVQRYEESREVLLMAYDRSPIGRMIIYRLAEVAVKMKDFQAAQDYYDEFVEIAPHDTLKYVLRYDIQKAQGASYEELIPILEELKEQEYTEEWAYELAYLYHKAGMSEKCIDACDELVLWFGDGPYVERALELKMLYQPLTKTQEEKYRSFCQAKDDRAGLTHIDVEEMARAGETVHDPVAIPKVEVNTERFNTVNLQAEIAKGMQQIMDATEKEEVNDSMDAIKKMVEEIPYLQLPHESEEQKEEKYGHIETDEEIDGSLKINFKEMLAEDSDGQISLYVPKDPMVERQITGQMSIQEVLEEWEKTKRAAEAALQEAEQRRLESAKARALQEAEEHEADRRGQSTLQRHKDGLHSTGNIDTGDLNDQPAARDHKHDGQQGVKPLTNEVGNGGILFEERELSERTKDQTNDNAGEDGNEHTVGTVQGVALAHFLSRLRVDADHKEHHAREAREDALLTEALFLAVVKGDQEGGHQADFAHRPAEGSPEAGQSGNVVVQDGADAEDRACQNEGQQLHHRVLDDHDPSQVRDLLQFRRERIFEPFNEFIHWFPPHLCCRWSAALFSAGPLPCLVP